MTTFYKKISVLNISLSGILFIACLAINKPALSQVRENPNALELPAAQNKALLEGLIKKIDNEAQTRLIQAMDRGKPLSVVPQNGEMPVIAKLDNKTLYLLDNSCVDIAELSYWNVLYYPLHVDTSSEADARTPRNLKALLKKNGLLVENEASKACFSYITFPHQKPYKIIGYKDVGKKRSWLFEETFVEPKIYRSLNRVNPQNKSLSNRAIICKIATRLCYRNSRKPEYVSKLSGNGLVGGDNKVDASVPFYMETRKTDSEISALFPKFEIEPVTPVTSEIVNFISKNLKHTVIISVRDNAMGHLKEEDLSALKRVGVDMSDLKIRGAHISILKRGSPEINITDNQKPVSLSPDDHKIPNLGLVYSAGFAMGDNSAINLDGENISPNKRGINIAVIDSKGHRVTSKNFDTHISSNRSLGYYKARVVK